ncbi:PREDICTED: uncharacterized protein C14orf79 homolog [Acanthisitta chloris]|uniref:uncharacterized protein C14orf79 homolog n=1 Tax=Acanthisitta chloris TaxID=57068 RepID=UPI0004F0E00C|nr:PREDICTED: uncharacterized protein C14orf79 homolog [Acanthisitta chloris]
MQNLSLGESLTGTDTSHQGSLKDLAAEAGAVSLDESGCNWNERTSSEEIINLEVMQQSLPGGNSKGRSCEEVSESSFSASEPSGSWGDFEGFRESLDEAERVGHNAEDLVKSTEPSGAGRDFSSNSAVCLGAEPLLCSRTQEASGSLDEAEHSYEDIFKLGFPEVFVPRSTESIRSLEQVLATNNEDVGIPELWKDQLCMDSGNLWRTLRDFDHIPSLRYPWSKSHSHENLLSVLGIDANQTDNSKSQEEICEESNGKDNEDLRFDGFGVNDCKALIQTKVRIALSTAQNTESISILPFAVGSSLGQL